MMRSVTALALLTVSLGLPSSGCSFYFADDDSVCDYGGGNNATDPAPGEPLAPTELRNPATGECEPFYLGGGGGGGGTSCGDPCGDCPPSPEPVPLPDESDSALPSWGYCESACTGLPEFSCLSAPGCRAVYTGAAREFQECWATDQNGPLQGADCTTLDAYQCSLYDDCAPVHADACADSESDSAFIPSCVGGFITCTPETVGCYGDDECGESAHCNADEVCLPDPLCGGTEGWADCAPVCYGYCVPNTAGDPGECYAPVACDEGPPACPTGTTPGIKDLCYTGYCIPIGLCEMQMSCAEIFAEATCIARTDCTPLYKGADCTCDAQGNNCVCNTLEYERCTP